ncbi:hypothetical protein P7C70_g6556, partial [Phenoliferia sp. Uapishka_3]
MFSPDLNHSSSSLDSMGSLGSSYHAEMDAELAFEDDDLDVELKEEGADCVQVEGEDVERETERDEGELDNNLHVVESIPMSRRPSDELLKDIPSSSAGETDFVLRDLVLIQEALVQSASHKEKRRREQEEEEGQAEDAGPRPVSPRADEDNESSHERNEGDAVAGELPSVAVDPTSSRKSVGKSRESGHSLAHGSSETKSSNEARKSVDDWFDGKPSFVVSSPMTPQTSEDSCSEGRMSYLDSPATMQSDAFEFSTLNLDGTSTSLPHFGPSEEVQELLVDSSSPPPVPTLLGAPVALVDNGPTLRPPRTTPRNPQATQSVLIRDVRNQANLATMNLKKTGAPLSKRSGSGKLKNVRSANISSPQLIEAPDNIPAVPIQRPQMPDSELVEPRSPLDTRVKKSGSMKQRFKKLLNKQSRDHLRTLNGEEVTPFVDFELPSTPPDQHTSQFPSTPSEFPHTPDYPETPEFSPALSLSPSMDTTPDFMASSDRTTLSASTSSITSSTSHGANHRSLGRFVSRFRRPQGELDSLRSLDVPATTLPSSKSVSPSLPPIVAASPLTMPFPQQIPDSPLPPTSMSGGSAVAARMFAPATDSPFASSSRTSPPSTSVSLRKIVSRSPPPQSPQPLSPELEPIVTNPLSLEPRPVAPESEPPIPAPASPADSAAASSSLSNSSPGRAPLDNSSFLSADDISSRRKMMRLSKLSARASTVGSSLRPPVSPGGMSTRSSYRSSGYGSIYDLYGDDSAEPDSPPPVPEMDGHEESAEAQAPDQPELDEGVVWQAHHALKGHRLSTDNYSFHTRQSSTDSQASLYQSKTIEPIPTPDPIQQLALRKHRRKTSAQAVFSAPPFPGGGRFPSIFMREEERLQMIASQGGIAADEQGFFLVRPGIPGEYDDEGQVEPTHALRIPLTQATPLSVIIAHIPVKESSVEEVKAKLSEYAAKYRTDEGTLAWCVLFKASTWERRFVHQDVNAPTKFAIVERYENEGSLKAHTANPAYPTFFPWLKPHLGGKPEILRYNELPVSVANKESKL